MCMQGQHLALMCIANPVNSAGSSHSKDFAGKVKHIENAVVFVFLLKELVLSTKISCF